MPPKPKLPPATGRPKKASRPSGHSQPGRKAVTFSLSEIADDRLRQISEAEAEIESQRTGGPVRPNKTGALETAIYRRWLEVQGGTTESA